MTQSWWSAGLKFTCIRCGACCGREPGVVRFTAGELAAMADALGVSEEEFKLARTWRKYGAPSLRERENYDCVFLKYTSSGSVCGIYSARPSQCSAFPFWTEILKKRENWERRAASCPGMNRGTFYTYEEIVKITVNYAVNSAANFL